MGLLKAGAGAIGGVLADQWREFFYCDSLTPDILMMKGQVRTSDRSSNTKRDDNIISNGSVIAVNEGQCMIIVEQGAIVDVCADPGQFVYDSSTEPSIFYGQLGESILESFKQMGSRFTFGGGTGKDQRVYFFNTKEIIGNKYGTSSPIPFRIVDANIGLDLDTAVRCNGEYSYKLVDPILFYKNVCGNAAESYSRSEIDSQMRSELLKALQPVLARLSAMGIRYSAIPAHTAELADFLNEELSAEWSQRRGIEIASFGVNSITISEEDEKLIKEMQKAGALRDPSLAAASIASAQSDAMRAAASNEGGAMNAFLGMGMAGMAGGMSAQGLFDTAAAQNQQPRANAYGVSNNGGFGGAQQPAAAQASGWTCACGTQNTGKFCSNCGTAMPEPAAAWTCTCGTQNTGKFCSNCGSAKPEAPASWTCACGTTNDGKFCSNCGSPRA